MNGKCIHHPGRNATIEYDNQKYCGKCEKAQIDAGKVVDRHVEPKECFVWYRGGYKWVPIIGTGCAHWVAHKKGIRHGLPIHKCLKGYTFKVTDIAKGCKKVKSLKNIKVGDIYIDPKKKHCGIVSKVEKFSDKSAKLKIEIEHDSSNQGRVAKNDFTTYFGGKGSFFR